MNAIASRFGIVEPLSSGMDLPKELAKRGWEVVIIQSDVGYVPKLQHAQEVIVSNNYFIPYTGNIEDTVQRLKELDVIYIVTGFESAVCFADQLNHYLQLPANGIGKSLARRNKYAMHQAVQECGLRVPKQKAVCSGQEALLWKHASTLSYPIVIKPLASGGADGFALIQNDFELVSEVEKLIGTQDTYGQLNNQVLVQEYVEGLEYIVNTVTVDGCHYITDVWVYGKGPANGAAVVDFDSKLLDYRDVDPQLIQYAKDVLNALEYRIGPAHMEIKIDPQNQPVLIEVGARLAGIYGHRVVQKCTHNGKSQLEYAIDSYLDKNRLEELKDGYIIEKQALIACLISSKEGLIKKINHLDEIEALSSFQEMKLSLSAGENLLRTTDLHTSPGYAFLVHEDLSQLMKDYAQLRLLEKDMFTVTAAK